MPLVKLITKAQWDKLTSWNQGYACYMLGSRPGSELKDIASPSRAGSVEHKDFLAGQFQAMLDVQDGEE